MAAPIDRLLHSSPLAGVLPGDHVWTLLPKCTRNRTRKPATPSPSAVVAQAQKCSISWAAGAGSLTHPWRVGAPPGDRVRPFDDNPRMEKVDRTTAVVPADLTVAATRACSSA